MAPLGGSWIIVQPSAGGGMEPLGGVVEYHSTPAWASMVPLAKGHGVKKGWESVLEMGGAGTSVDRGDMLLGSRIPAPN